VGIYPSAVFYFHVRREIEGAGGGNPQTFLLFYYFVSAMRSYLRRTKYEKPFRTVNRYRSMIFSVILSLFEPRFSKPFLQNDHRTPVSTVFTCYSYLETDALQSERSRSQWLSRLSRGSAAARWLGLLVRVSPGACMSASCECYVLSHSCLRVGLFTLSEESYRVCVCVCASVVAKP
jgi:hypothetical protein